MNNNSAFSSTTNMLNLPVYKKGMEEYQYLELLQKLINCGEYVKINDKIGLLYYGIQMRFLMKETSLPFVVLNNNMLKVSFMHSYSKLITHLCLVIETMIKSQINISETIKISELITIQFILFERENTKALSCVIQNTREEVNKVPEIISVYYLLCQIVAKKSNLQLNELIYSLGIVYIYENNVENALKQISTSQINTQKLQEKINEIENIEFFISYECV